MKTGANATVHLPGKQVKTRKGGGKCTNLELELDGDVIPGSLSGSGGSMGAGVTRALGFEGGGLGAG